MPLVAGDDGRRPARIALRAPENTAPDYLRLLLLAAPERFVDEVIRLAAPPHGVLLRRP